MLTKSTVHWKRFSRTKLLCRDPSHLVFKDTTRLEPCKAKPEPKVSLACPLGSDRFPSMEYCRRFSRTGKLFPENCLSQEPQWQGRRHLWRSSFQSSSDPSLRRSDFSHLINGEMRRAIKKINLAQFVIFLMGSDNRLVAFVNYETDSKIRF